MTAEPHTPVRVVANRYELHEAIGQGTSMVYSGIDTACYNLPVAVKLLPDHKTGDPVATDRLFAEAELLRSLPPSSHIVGYHDHSPGPIPYLVMELVAGQPLKGSLGRRMSPARVADLGRQLCEALSVIESAGYVHRDVKPSNIMVQGNYLTLLDFSSAQPAVKVSWSYDPALTSGSDILEGTLQYMSPEAAMGQPVDIRSDLFSVGSILYQLLTGRPAFGGPQFTQIALALQICSEQPPLLEALDAYYGALGLIVQIALSKDPARRYRSAAEMAECLSVAG